MPKIFRCKTQEGCAFKILAELLQSNIKTACLTIDHAGITLRMMDTQKKILIDLELESDKFSLYKFKPDAQDENMVLGLNLNHFHKMLKNIKKKDSVELFIDSSSPTDLGIVVTPKENNRITTSYVKIQPIKVIQIKDVPSGYGRPVIVPSGEFQKMCKSLPSVSKVTLVSSKGFMIRFSTDMNGVMRRWTEFGEPEDDDDDDVKHSSDTATAEYNEEFDTENLTRIAKLSGLSSTLQIYTKSDNPLLLKTDVGTIGRVSVYLKSKNMQESESKAVESDEEEEDV